MEIASGDEWTSIESYISNEEGNVAFIIFKSISLIPIDQDHEVIGEALPVQ